MNTGNPTTMPILAMLPSISFVFHMAVFVFCTGRLHAATSRSHQQASDPELVSFMGLLPRALGSEKALLKLYCVYVGLC